MVSNGCEVSFRDAENVLELVMMFYNLINILKNTEL